MHVTSHLRAGVPARPDLSIVIPAFNEANRITRTLAAIRRYAEVNGKHIELIVVDDGSMDQTAEIARDFDAGPLTVEVLVNETNRGKGYSVRRGMLAAHGRVLLMSDADMSTPIEDIEKLLPWIEDGHDVAIGSRNMPESELRPSQPLPRRMMGAMFRSLRRGLLRDGVRDSQCGFKCFTAAAAQEVFHRQSETGFAFDCEILAIARRLGLRIREVGVLWCDNRDSRVRPIRDSWRMLVAIFRIRSHIRRLDGAANAAEMEQSAT